MATLAAVEYKCKWRRRVYTKLNTIDFAYERWKLFSLPKCVACVCIYGIIYTYTYMVHCILNDWLKCGSKCGANHSYVLNECHIHIQWRRRFLNTTKVNRGSFVKGTLFELMATSCEQNICVCVNVRVCERMCFLFHHLMIKPVWKVIMLSI